MMNSPLVLVEIEQQYKVAGIATRFRDPAPSINRLNQIACPFGRKIDNELPQTRPSQRLAGECESIRIPKTVPKRNPQ